MITEVLALTVEELAFLLTFENDREEAPWMVGNDYHRQAINALLYPLERFVQANRPDLYVSSEIVVLYRRPYAKPLQVAPDVMIALADNHPRDSFDAHEEGAFPAFVLEVVSKESRIRDARQKVELYRLVGAQEYIIFDPLAVVQPPLQGYYRDERDDWRPMPSGAGGELTSEFLQLTFERQGALLRIRDREGRLLPIPDEEHQARLRAESEAAELRAELARLRRGGQ